MRHHPEDVGVPVLVQNFAGAFIRFRSIAIIDAGHNSPWGSEIVQSALLNSRFHLKEYRADDKGSTACSGRASHCARKSLSKFHLPRINRLHASQNAAALLFDLGMVDIR
jgi:hypothetical protein